MVSDIQIKIVTLCGSIRFKDDFIKAQNELTLQGNIVISTEFFDVAVSEDREYIWSI